MDQQKLNILFLPKWYPSKFDKFDGNFIENHAKAIAKFCDVNVLFVHSDSDVHDSALIEKSKKVGFTEYRVFFKKPNYLFRPLNPIISAYRYFKAQKFGFKEISEESPLPDLIHLHINGRNALLALYLKVFKKIPFLLTEHWSGYTEESNLFKGVFRKIFYPLVAKKAETITVVSNYLQKAMEANNLKGNYSIISNVVDTKVFNVNRKERYSKKRIIHISNLSTTPKNMPLIIEALDVVAKERTDFEFILLGTGAEEKRMLKLLDESSLKDRYTYLGEINSHEVANQLTKADFMLLYSTFETQSVVMLESFASGTPVLVSNVGGIPEYIDDKKGIILEPNKKEVLIQGIRQMLDNSNNYDPKYLNQYALDNFSEEVIGQKFLKLYKTILTIG